MPCLLSVGIHVITAIIQHKSYIMHTAIQLVFTVQAVAPQAHAMMLLASVQCDPVQWVREGRRDDNL